MSIKQQTTLIRILFVAFLIISIAAMIEDAQTATNYAQHAQQIPAK